MKTGQSGLDQEIAKKATKHDRARNVGLVRTVGKRANKRSLSNSFIKISARRDLFAMDESYATELAKMAVARACVALGFKNCQTSALESLADIMKHYIQTMARGAHEQAEAGGRAYIGIQDVIPVLESTVIY